VSKGKRGGGSEHFALWEELKYLKVEATGKPVAIYKRLDAQPDLPLEDRNYYAHFPIRGTRGKRKSLLVTTRAEAETRAQEETVNMRVQLQQGVTFDKTTVQSVVEKFLSHKASRVRDAWEGKQEAGRKTITKARYGLIRGKLENYLVPFLGAKTDAKSIPKSKWSEWEGWRRVNGVQGGAPKADTLLNEMGHIRECWKWAMEQGLIPHSPVLPFHDENLATDDKVRRETWELQEWNAFKSRLPKWLRMQQDEKAEKDWWDCFIAYQMLFFLANNGMRTGEVVKLKRKDIKFYERALVGEEGSRRKDSSIKQLCCLVQVDKSTKTGAREVNSMGGKFAMAAYEKAPCKKKGDFLFQHLDGSPWTTKQFWLKFKDILVYTGEEERLGKKFVPYSLRHFYATTRLQNGTSKEALCRNMGVTEAYLRKHYDHSLTRLATADLMRMRDDIGMGGKFLKEGEDFALLDD
tara:strand:+ start:1088 stop:2479 length:1392 start_codon:yes stop_codon:yes gene_type:complete